MVSETIDRFVISEVGKWQLLHFRVFEKRVSEAVAFLRQNKIEPLLIKGWAAAQYYPEPSERGFSDVDLMVAAADYKKGLKFLENFRDPVDLHLEAKHLDTLSFEQLFANSELVKCGQTEIRVLCREDHLRILCVHWLIDGGAKKDKLWDIFYAVKNRPADFDWKRCLETVSPTRRRWIVCTIGLAHKYLELDISDLPFADECRDIPVWLIKAIEKEWKSGTLLLPMHLYLNDRKEIWKQIKKRLPPNAVQATVDLEGEFDNKPRIFYQIADIFYRLMPSVRRMIKGI